MGEIEKSRKERLRACERVLAEHMEEFVKVGLALKEIRDERLYKEDGWSDFDKYTREKWGWGRRYVDNTISSAELRLALPSPSEVRSSGSDSESQEEWTERSVRELKRLGSSSKAKAVAERVVKEVKEKKAQGQKVKLGSVVRKHVDEALGTDRGRREPEPTVPAEAEARTKELVFKWTGEVNGMAAVIEEMPQDALREFGERDPGLVKGFAEAVARLQKAWDVTRPTPAPRRRIVEA